MKSYAFIQNYLQRKRVNNPAYSLRALARDMDLSPSFLSEVVNGKKRLPRDRMDRLCELLDIDKAGRRQLQTFMAREILQVNKIDDSLLARSSDDAAYTPASRKSLDFLSPWYVPAILDLSTCADFRPDPVWIADRLGLKREIAAIVVKRLKDHGMLVEKNGKLTKFEKKIRIPARESRAQIRRYHTEMMTRAIQTMDKQDEASYSRRLISGVTTAANPAQVEKAKQRLHEVIHEVTEILSKGSCTEVYQLNLQCFPLTR